MDIAALVAEVERTLKAYKDGDYDYQPQFAADTDWGNTLAESFADFARRLKEQSQAEATMRTEAEALFEQTKESIAEAKVLHLAARSLNTFDNLPKMLEKIVDNVATALPADTVMLVTLADNEIRHVVAGGSGGISTDISPDDFFAGLSGWALREMEPVLSPKNKPEARESVKVHQRRAENNIGAVAVVPVHIGEQALGTLTAMNRLDQRDFSERDIKLMRAMANHVATAIANAELYQQSRQEIRRRKKIEKTLTKERDLLNALMENVPDFIYFKDTRSHYVRSNTAHATHLLGAKTAEAVIGKTDFDFFAEEEAKARYDLEQEILRSGQPQMAREMEITTHTGEKRWLSEHIIPYRNTGGKIIGLVGIGRDISRMKQMEAMLAHRATELEAVTQVGTDISRVLDTDELLQRVVDLTKSAFSLYHAHVYVLDGQLLRLVAGAGDVGRQMVAEGWHIPLENTLSVVARAARSAEPVVLNRVHRGTDFLQNPLLPHTRAELAVPLAVGGDVLGVLDVQADTVGFFADEDVPVYAALGAQVAVALQNARLFSRAQATLAETEALYNVSRTLNTITELPALLHSVAQMVAESLSATWTMLVTVDMISNRIEQKTAVGPDAEDMLPETFDDLMASLSGWVLTQVQPLLSPKGEPDSRESLEQQQRRLRMGIGSIVIVPLHYHDKLLGVLSAINPMHGRDFTEQDVNLLTAIGNQVAAAIENRNLLAHSQKRAQHEQAIREVTEKLRAAPNLDMLLETAAEELGTRLGVRHSVLELGIDRPAASETRQNPPENEDGESHV